MSANSAHIVNYSRINPYTGSGFILRRLFEDGPMTKRAVYEGSRYGNWVPGYHSAIWSKLFEDGLIATDGGKVIVKCPKSYWRVKSHFTVRAVGKGRIPVYHITDKGKHILAEMLDRCNAKA